MSEIVASLFGCIAIFPRLTNLSVVIDDLLNQSIEQYLHHKVSVVKKKFKRFDYCAYSWYAENSIAKNLGYHGCILLFLCVFFYFKQHLQKAFFDKIKTNGYLWPKNQFYKWFFNFFQICRMGLKNQPCKA